jgi:hypothetical protein
VTRSSARIAGVTTDPKAATARFVLDPREGTAHDDETPTVTGDSRRFSTTATGLTPDTTYSFVVEFLDNHDHVLGASAAGGCDFRTLPPPPVFLCVAASWITDDSATFGGLTTSPDATLAHFILIPPDDDAIVPDDDSVTVSGASRKFATIARNLTAGTTYTVEIEFRDAADHLLGKSDRGACTLTEPDFAEPDATPDATPDVSG